MKKLMIALAAVAMGVAAQASIVTWGVSNVMPQATGADVTSYTAYIIDNAAYDYDSVNANTVMAAIAKAADSGSLVKTSSSATTGKLANTTFEDSYVENDQPTYYAIIVTGDSKYYEISAEKSAKVTSAGKLAMVIGNMGGATWTAVATVPEPTTGLLMLLGMGALALRRRRA